MSFRRWQIGLHIQQDNIAAVALLRERSRWSLRRWWRIPLATGIVEQGLIVQPEGVIAALSAWRRELPFQHQVRMAFPAERTRQKELPRPAMRLREPAQTRWVVNTVAQAFEMPPSSLQIDYTQDTSRNTYQVTAAQREDIQHLLTLIRVLKLQVTAITPDACALQHFFPWLAASDGGLVWRGDGYWLWATRHHWGYQRVPFAELTQALPDACFPLVHCTAQMGDFPGFDPWSAISLRQPPLPAHGDDFAIAIALALGAS